MEKMTINLEIIQKNKEINIATDIKGTCSSSGLSKAIARLLMATEKSTSASVILNALDEYTNLREKKENED